MSRFFSLKRGITITEKGVLLSTQNVVDVNYAFYLHTSKVIHKKFYIQDSMWEFNESLTLGKFYTADFYYKYKEEVEKYSLVFKPNNSNDGVQVVSENIIADEQGFKISFYDQQSDITFIVFNGYGSTKSSKPFGLEFLLGLGYNVICCLQQNNQYQELSFDVFKKHVTKIVENKKVFLYGSSLGAYAAVYYAGAVNGTVIAAAPKNSAHPHMVGQKNKFKAIKFNHDEIINNPKTNNPVYIIIDTICKPDIFFLDKFIKPAYPNLNVIPFDYAGHTVLYHVNKTKQLKPLILDIVNGNNLRVDSCVESVYTDLGRANFYLNKLDKSNCLLYLNKVFSSTDINDNIRNQANLISEKIKKI
ncbi:hypothetical protein [Acinetobacter thermotolerans]|uniref:hypothetical protein n=1 Tax=Acinetobacter thermotolerans TaxID=3151487 RepID=UPI00325BE211